MSMTVRFSRLPSQGVVYGFDKASLTVLMVAGISAAIAVVSHGALGLLLSLPVTGTLAATGVLKLHGEPWITHIFREALWLMRKATGANTYRHRPEKRTAAAPQSVLSLPGREGRLHLYETSHGAVVVWDAAAGTATVTCMVATRGMGVPQHDAPSTVDEGTREALIWEWAKVLGSFTQKPHIERVTVTEHTRPGTAAAERLQYEQQATSGTGVNDSYAEALILADEVSVQHVTQLSVTFSLSGEARTLAKGAGGGIAGMLALAELEMQTVQEALWAAGFSRVAWVSPREWGAWARSIIDPAAQESIDTRIGTQYEGVDPQAATPMVIDEKRTSVETDSAWHRTYWIQEWPRYDTHPGFLSRLVFAKQQNGRPVRHTFGLVATPTRVAKAMKRLDDEKRTWITNQALRAKAGKPQSAADESDWHAIEQHERELVSGQGELLFSAYLTVTATDEAMLERESASMLNACAATGLEPRIIPGGQWEALATVAYPCGLGMR